MPVGGVPPAGFILNRNAINTEKTNCERKPL